jgi:hypothetical protein
MGGVLFWISSAEGGRLRSMLMISQTRRCCDAVLDRRKLYNIETWNSPYRHYALAAHARVLAQLVSSNVLAASHQHFIERRTPHCSIRPCH